MPANIPILYTTINLAGATSSIDIGIPYLYYIYESVGGNLSGNYTIQASATPTIDTVVNIKKKGNVSLNGFTFSVFGVQLTEEQANKELSITVIYNFTSASWDVFIDIDTSQLPSIYEGVESTAVPTSGTKTLLPNINRKWQVFTGSQTLVGNYTITGTGSQDGQEFWIIWNSTLDLNGNTLSIFGLTIPEGDAIGGNFAVYTKYNGSAWIAKFVDGHYGIWESGSGLRSALKLGSGSTVSGDNSTDLGRNNTVSGDNSLASGENSTASADYTTVSGNANVASAEGAIAMGYGNTASDLAAVALGEANTASGERSVALGYTSTASGDESVAIGLENTALGVASNAIGKQSRARQTGTTAQSAGNISNLATKPNQKTVNYLRKSTTNSTLTELFIDGTSEVLTIPANSSCSFKGTVNAIQTAGSAGAVGDSKAWEFSGLIKNIAGVTSLVLVDEDLATIIFTSSTRLIPNVHLNGTAQSGSASTIVLEATAPATNDYFNGAIITIVSGTGAGQSRIVADYVGSTYTITPNFNFGVAPDSSSVYMIRHDIAGNTNTAAWDVTVTADNASDSLQIEVKGETNKTISWHAIIEINEVCY